MSVAVILQALGWVSVVGLVTVHLLIQKGRLPADGTAYRIAGCVASASVVAAAAAEKIWPVAVLGLLWLRIEVFGHPARLSPGPAPDLLPHPHLPHLPHPHLPNPRPRTVDRIFKAEMAVVIAIAVVLFGVWAEQQRTSFRQETDQVVCNWIEGC
jgi:hypothetical protein